VFRASDMRAVKEAVIAGIGIGFVAGWDRNRTEDLVDMLPPLEEWSARIWLVTHMDLHRTAKVQSFVRHLKSEVMTWPVDEPGGK
jgi:DNA-binding transcriptional LysR family regulator